MPDFDPNAFLQQYGGASSTAQPSTFDPEGFLKTYEAPGEEVSKVSMPQFSTPKSGVDALREKYRNQLYEQRGPEPSYGERFLDSALLGTTRPLTGLVQGVKGIGDPTSTFGERYKAGVGAAGDYFDKAAANTAGPLGVATDIAGGLVTAPIGAGAGLGRSMLQAGVSGAIEGASRNADSLGNAAGGAATGGAIGAGGAGIIGGLLSRLGMGKAAQAEIGRASRGGTSLSQAMDAGAIFDKIENSGIHFSAKETPALANNINAITSGPLPASVRGEIDELVRNINSRVQTGTTPNALTIGDIRAIQSDISKLGKNMNPDVRRVAGEMQRGVDDFLGSARPTIPAASVGTVSKADLDEARRLYATSKHGGKIEGIAEAATEHAADPAKSTASAFKTYQDKFTKNPERPNPNNPEQRRLIDEIIATGKNSGLPDTIDKVSDSLWRYGSVPLAGGIGAMLGMGDKDTGSIGGGLTGAGGMMLGLGLLGKGTSHALRQQLAHQTAGKVDDLLRSIYTGSMKQAPGAYVPRNALATLIAKDTLARGAGNVAANEIVRRQEGNR